VFCGIKGEGGDVIGFSGVADETSCCVGVEGYHEEECLGLVRIDDGILDEGRTNQMVRIIESFKALFPDRVVGSGVHQEHDQEHPVCQHAP